MADTPLTFAAASLPPWRAVTSPPRHGLTRHAGERESPNPCLLFAGRRRRRHLPRLEIAAVPSKPAIDRAAAAGAREHSQPGAFIVGAYSISFLLSVVKEALC